MSHLSKLNDVLKESFIFLWEESSKMESWRGVSYKTKQNIQNMQLCNHHKYLIWNFKMGSFWETSSFTGKHPQQKVQMLVKGINQTQNLKELSGKRIWPLLTWLNIHLANEQSKQWGEKLGTISDQIEMNHWMALNCETGEFGFLQSCVWLVMKSHLLSSLPHYPQFPFSTPVIYRSYGPVLTVDTSMLKSEVTEGCEWKHSQTSFTVTGHLNRL